MKLIKKRNQKIISLILAILLLVTSVPWYVFAEDVKASNSEEINVNEQEDRASIIQDEETTEYANVKSKSNTKEELGNGREETNSNENITKAQQTINNQNLNLAEQTTNSQDPKQTEQMADSQSTDLTQQAEGSNELTETDIIKLNETSSHTDENSFRAALRFGGTASNEYNWNATKSEERVIKLTFYYQNEVTKRAYAPGDLVVTIPGIGNLNRENTIKATDIAADVYGVKELKRDWSYKYNQATDTYTFYNNHEIEQGATFNGSFEILWKFSSRNCINNYNQKIQATLTDGEHIVSTAELSLNYTSERDTFYINKEATAIVSADGLSKYVEDGKSVSNYAWVQYKFKYNVKELNARALQRRYFIDTLPKGCVIAKDENVIKSEDGVSYKIEETTVPENSVKEYSIIVGYPESYIGQTITNTVYLKGIYKDETEETDLAESTAEIKLEEMKKQPTGIVPGKDMSPYEVYRDVLEKDINFSASLYATATTDSENQGYEISITDDLLEIYTPANTESGKEEQYHTLQDNEYKFTSITVPGRDRFTNANGYTLSDGDYTVKLYALYKEDVETRALSEYTKIYEGKWETKSITQDIEKDAVAIRAEISGLTESIQSFYITTRGIINVAEKVKSLEYENPTYIVNYDFTELKDKDGNSLEQEIKEENYSEQRIYERDKKIYGKGVSRARDTIRIIERKETPGYYYAYSDIEAFTVDENVEYFITKLNHYTKVNNKDGREISKVEIYGVTEKEELERLIETLELTHNGLIFKNELSADTDMQDYLKERANITKEGREISITFDFSDNPIISKDFNLGYKIDARLNYEEYYNSINTSYTIITYSYLENSELQPQLTGSYNGKTMATQRDSESILLALSSHQQLIKMVKTMYTEDFVQEDAVSPMSTEYTYRLKLRNGYNTLVNTEFIDILEHAELTEVDGEHPYKTSEWYGTFKNIDTTYIESKGLRTKVYYANTLTPTETDWIQMENHSNGIWTTTENNKNEVKAVKIAIEGEIAENSIVYADINMLSPNDKNLVDKKTYNTYTINSDAIDLYTGMKSTYMNNMPSNSVDVRLVEKEYNVQITKTDEKSGNKLAGVLFGVYEKKEEKEEKIRTVITGLLGNATIRGLKEGTYIIKEELAPVGYEKTADYELVIKDEKYTLKKLPQTIQKTSTKELSFTPKDGIPWTQNPDGVWQSNNTYIDNSNQNNGTIATMTSNEFEVKGTGTLTFDWSVSSESASYDYVYYTITKIENDKTTQVSGTGTSTKIGGTSYGTVYESLDFKEVTKTLEPGTYKIEFTYRKDGSGRNGLDRAFVKNINIEDIFDEKTNEEFIAEGETELKGTIPTVNITIQNERAKGSITVHKIDEYLDENKQEIPLSGVEFDLLDTEGNIIQTGTTDTKGNIVFEELEWGQTYQIKEKQELQGYNLAETNTYLSKLNKDKTVTIKNIRKTGTVTLTKQDEVDGSKLEGATYGLYAENNIYDKEGNIIYEPNSLIKEATTNEQGQLTFDELIWGDYYLKEINTIYGYDLSEEKHLFTVNAQTVENVIEKTEKEKRSKSKLQLVKIDDKGNFLPGTEFKLYDKDGNEVIKTKEKTDEKEITFITKETSEASTEYGWTKQEDGTWQSENYHINSSTAIMESNNFTLEYDGKITFDWTVSSQGTTTDYAYYTITNTQTGEEIGGQDTKIGGTTYGTSYNSLSFNRAEENLKAGTYKITYTYVKDPSSYSGLDRAYVKNINVTYEVPNITNENGQLNIEELEWGDYYIQETKPVQGYEKINTKFNFTVNRETFANNNTTVTKVINEETKEEISIITNNRKKGKVTLTKYACDADGNEVEDPSYILPGAVYELYSADGTLINEYTTDENGQIIVTNLDWNSYYFQEKQAPEGYSISDKKISFVINSKNVDFEQSLTAYNKQGSGEITINKVIKADSVYAAHGNSSFIFKIVGKNEQNEEKITLYRAVTFTPEDIANADAEGNVTKTIKISDIERYKYEITEEENYRYKLSTIIPGINAEKDEGGKTGIINLLQTTESTAGTIETSETTETTESKEGSEENKETLAQNKGEITFANEKESNSLLTDNGLITNTTQSNYYLIGIGATPREESYVIGESLTAEDFIYTLYYSGGQEVQVELTEGVTFNGESSYTQTVVGDYLVNVECTVSGKVFKTEVVTKWVMPNDYFTYITLNTTEKTIAITGINTKYTSPEVLYIPSEYNGYKVQRAGKNPASAATYTSDNRLLNISNVKTIIIAEGAIEIGCKAFYNHSNLTYIKLPNSLEKIGSEAFNGCKELTSITIPEGVKEIWEYTFRNCRRLGSVKLPSSLTSIGNNAFGSCSSLTNIDLRNTQITSIGNYAFQYCSSLTSIDLSNSQITSIGYYAFQYCSSLTSIDLSNTQITSIGSSAFYSCSKLTNIDLSNTQITSIGSSAFQGCNKLTNIDLSNTQITSIGNKTFYGCWGLTSIEIPSSVTSIGKEVFYGCSSLTSIEIPSSVTSIEDSAFNSCSSLISINVEAGNENYCSIDGVLYNKDKTILIKYPEGKKDLTEYAIPAEVTSIGNFAFQYCSSLTSIEIPSSVTSIGSSAFNGCSSLTSIEIPSSVTSIGNYVFQSCSKLTNIDLSNTQITSIGNYAFNSCSRLTIIEIPSSVTSIGNYAFSYCSSLTSIEIPSSVTSIGSSAFNRCGNLTSIDLSNTQITSIGSSAFNSCSRLTSIEIPSSVTSIGDMAFYGCSKLTNIDLSNTQITRIGNDVFSGCSSLTSIEIPSSVTSIGNSAFINCSKLTTINYHGTEEQFAAITIGSNNTNFTNAEVIYNYSGS